jgi:hypothetical protein
MTLALLERQLCVNKYDLLKDTWIYQEIQQQVVIEQQRQRIEEQRLLLLEIVQARFPRLESSVRQLIEQTANQGSLRTMLLQISTARSEKEARRCLNDTAHIALK